MFRRHKSSTLYMQFVGTLKLFSFVELWTLTWTVLNVCTFFAAVTTIKVALSLFSIHCIVLHPFIFCSVLSNSGSQVLQTVWRHDTPWTGHKATAHTRYHSGIFWVANGPRMHALCTVGGKQRTWRKPTGEPVKLHRKCQARTRTRSILNS